MFTAMFLSNVTAMSQMGKILRAGLLLLLDFLITRLPICPDFSDAKDAR